MQNAWLCDSVARDSACMLPAGNAMHASNNSISLHRVSSAQQHAVSAGLMQGYMSS